MKMKYFAAFGLGAFLLIMMATGCASVPVRQGPVLAVSATETILGTIQDTETKVYAGGTGAESKAVHQKIAGALEIAFKAQIRAATALKGLKVGDPLPTSLADYATAVKGVITALQSLDVSPIQQSLLANAQQILTSITSILIAHGGN